LPPHHSQEIPARQRAALPHTVMLDTSSIFVTKEYTGIGAVKKFGVGKNIILSACICGSFKNNKINRRYTQIHADKLKCCS
jgi:hypothetical protein